MAATMRDLGRDLGAPVLVCLEGGYDPDALASSVAATVEALGGEGTPVPAPIEAAGAHVERAQRFVTDSGDLSRS